MHNVTLAAAVRVHISISTSNDAPIDHTPDRRKREPRPCCTRACDGDPLEARPLWVHIAEMLILSWVDYQTCVQQC